jgi:hypothetical protein
MSYCPECKKPLTSYTGNFRWCELCGYTSKVKAHSAISEFEGYRLRDVVKSLTLENKAFKKELREWCENKLGVVKEESMGMPSDWSDQYVLDGMTQVLNTILERFCGGS